MFPRAFPGFCDGHDIDLYGIIWWRDSQGNSSLVKFADTLLQETERFQLGVSWFILLYSVYFCDLCSYDSILISYVQFALFLGFNFDVI